MKTIKISATVVLGFVYLISILSLASALVIDSVILDSEGVGPGEIADIEIGLKNNGEYDVRDVSVFLDLKDVSFAPFDSNLN